ncbi:MAG: protein kinase [Planctomycetales bacterium]|nr:protein kinase [Planctomycetales bacterium]
MNAQMLDARQVFLEAVEKHAPEHWPEFLNAACGGDAALRERVQLLLNAHGQYNSLLDGEGVVATIDRPASERPGAQIGPYKLLQQIGEGGFGVVFMAEQVAPVRRKVALKVIKPGMDTRQVIARFEAERQALAVMDHPNIAKVLDAGATESGRPYFVMELVRGVPITQYCDENSLSVRERLELFATVCQAIQHAHTKGIIHRDIKPTNVLVTRQDSQPVVKVIDFGIAKAMGQQLTDKTLFTDFARMIGTPLYMSPEQAELSSTDIDTRSDIYSLGVLLYELLTGSTPVSKEQLKQAAFDEVRRIIREDEPQKPSTRISSAEAAPSIAAQRHTEPAKLTRLVRGELDWIVMKALEKDRNRRYETASGFARDVERYLHDEPVQACPPSSWYRFGKFARRKKGAIVLTFMAVLAAVLTLIGLSVSNVLITQEKNLKVAALEEAKINEEEAKKQLRRAEDNLELAVRAVDRLVKWGPFGIYPNQTINEFMLPDELVSMREGAKFYSEFANQNDNPSRSRSWSRIAYGRAAVFQLGLGEYGEADRTLRLLIGLLERMMREDPAMPEYRWELAEAYLNLAEVLEKTDREAEGERTYREALRLAGELLVRGEQLKSFPHRDPNEESAPEFRHQLAWGYLYLGRLLHRTGQFMEAESAYKESLAWLDRQAGTPCYAPTEACLRATAMGGLGQIMHATGRQSEAENAYREACGIWDKILAESPGDRHYLWNHAASRQSLGDFFYETGHRPSAAAAYRESLSVWERLTVQYPTVPAYPRQLAWRLVSTPQVEFRDPGRALELARKAVELAPDSSEGWNVLGVAHYRVGNWKDAVAGLEKAMALSKGGNSFNWFFLAMAYWQLGDQGESRGWHEKAVAWMNKHRPKDEELRHIQSESAELLKTENKKNPNPMSK